MPARKEHCTPTLSLSPSHTHTLTHPCTLSLSLTVAPHTHTPWRTHTRTVSGTHTHIHTHTHTHCDTHTHAHTHTPSAESVSTHIRTPCIHTTKCTDTRTHTPLRLTEQIIQSRLRFVQLSIECRLITVMRGGGRHRRTEKPGPTTRLKALPQTLKNAKKPRENQSQSGPTASFVHHSSVREDTGSCLHD